MQEFKNQELRSALMYFVDEAIGYRHSIHFLHRWIETGEQSELEGLILEVGREKFIDLQPILDSIKDPANFTGHTTIQNFAEIYGLYDQYNGTEWPYHFKPMPKFDNSNPYFVEGNHWALHNWLVENTANNTNFFFVVARAHSLIKEAREDFQKVFVLLEMMFGKDTTLFSSVLNDNIPLLGRLLSDYYPAQREHIVRLAESIDSNRHLNWKDALSRNQIKSKLWLIDKLSELKWFPKIRRVTDPASTVLLVGGWVGMLPFLADMKGNYLDTVINVDVDTSVHGAAHELNSITKSNLKVSSKDIRTLNVKQYSNVLVVDTIVEHFENHGEWVKTLPSGTQVVLQGNDMFHVPDHVNCHKTLEEFVASCGLNNIIWAGELNLYKCTRFMAIGTT